MFAIGDRVRVKAPFDQFYPGVWEIIDVAPDTGVFRLWEGDGGEFDANWLEAAE